MGLVGLCSRQSMDHEGFKDENDQCDGGRCRQILDSGYSGTAENVLVNTQDLDIFVSFSHNEWMNSSGHRKNIMKPEFTAVGYGFYTCRNGGSSSRKWDQPSTYATGLFGA